MRTWSRKRCYHNSGQPDFTCATVYSLFSRYPISPPSSGGTSSHWRKALRLSSSLAPRLSSMPRGSFDLKSFLCCCWCASCLYMVVCLALLLALACCVLQPILVQDLLLQGYTNQYKRVYYEQ